MRPPLGAPQLPLPGPAPPRSPPGRAAEPPQSEVPRPPALSRPGAPCEPKEPPGVLKGSREQPQPAPHLSKRPWPACTAGSRNRKAQCTHTIHPPRQPPAQRPLAARRRSGGSSFFVLLGLFQGLQQSQTSQQDRMEDVEPRQEHQEGATPPLPSQSPRTALCHRQHLACFTPAASHHTAWIPPLTLNLSAKMHTK